MGELSHEPVMRGSRRMGSAVDFKSDPRTKRYKPRAIVCLKDLLVEAGSLLGERSKMFGYVVGRRFVTFGSCFATNVAATLGNRGATVFTNCITEDVNSPFNNRLLLRRVFLGEHCPFIDTLGEMTGINFDEMGREFAAATDVIFTLGNVFRLSGGDVSSKNGRPLERETYEETRGAIQDILDLLAKHTRARVFVSVSPVPISGYRGTEYLSVYEADCASKCQLLTAVRSLEGFTYVPTFEIFRWFAAHQSFPTFGYDNGNQRHIFPDQIEGVIGLLIQ